MNPELEPQPAECPDCHGERYVPIGFFESRACGTCDGLGSITQDAADQRDAAAEAKWENQRDK